MTFIGVKPTRRDVRMFFIEIESLEIDSRCICFYSGLINLITAVPVTSTLP